MKLLFVHSHIFKYDNKKNYYSEGKLTYNMWKQRYLKYFKEITVAGRGSKIGEEELNLSSGPNVEHYILPNTSTIKNRISSMKKLKRDLKYLIEKNDTLVARIPSNHAYEAIKIAKKLNKPYVLEVVGDAFSALWTHGNIFGKVLAPINFIKYRKAIRQANHLIYVTESYLQTRYPPKTNSHVINASNVDLPPTSVKILKHRIKLINKINVDNEINIGVIGSYTSNYKGFDTAIKAIKILNQDGYNFKIKILGSGSEKRLLSIAKNMNVDEKIIFSGSLPGGEAVFKWLDSLDLYIQPSLTEGLPRSLIEAMSRGLPCIASSAGGMPELINDEFIHKPKSEKELSEKIIKLVKNKEKMINESKRNYERSQDYIIDVLNEKRKIFWKEFTNEEL